VLPILSPLSTCTVKTDDLKRCTRCGEEKPRAQFSRDRSRKDGRYPPCKACVMRWHHENAEHLADYHRRWQQENRRRSVPRTATIGSGSAKIRVLGAKVSKSPVRAPLSSLSRCCASRRSGE
jgi:hypothetical protein